MLGLTEYKSAVLVGKGALNTRSKKENKNIACECEARVRAFLRMLRVGEGTGELIKSYDYNKKETIYIHHDFQKGYTIAFGGNKITDLSKHPEVNYGGSTAEGAYQIMRYVWWELNGNQVVKNSENDYIKTGIREEYHNYVKKYKIPDYRHESQDKLCVIIMKHYCKKLIDTIIDNNIEKAIRDYASLKWASLPHKGDNSYHEYKGKPQPATPMKICIEHYEIFLKDELNEVSCLHLKKGFLKEFEYACRCSNNNKGLTKWQNPLKKNQITIHTYGGIVRPWRSAFGRVRTDMSGSDNGARPHHGLDLFAEIGTEVFACLPGEVVSLTPGNGYGNGIVFKIDDNYLSEFKKQRRNYSPYYIKSNRTYDSNKYNIDGYGDFEEYEGINESVSVYLMYAHLSEISVKLNDKITESNMNTVLGKTGTSGATNTKGPHLHFEIRSKQNPSGYAERYNPAYYIDYKNEEQMTASERKIQDDTAGK
ncbi:M23 family metallopeptidase [Flavobacterium sp. PL002]|uniref:M23 family metallopeptidase n=1 Tax=Flavobacterium sp. PL002 TaxID=1897058 RepID=UPI001787A6C1|nr:peptidoglycan DD-metalloendopeptidase family protein [Flavobacterium sp. PL002]MBE0393766.1 hypothetical protein [Flavobacterium sp. PL002]